VITTYNILDMNAQTFRRWAKLMHGRSSDLIEDMMIAATADINGLTVVTRNLRDFEGMGVKVFDPFGFKK
jgi:toxin FitB